MKGRLFLILLVACGTVTIFSLSVRGEEKKCGKVVPIDQGIQDSSFLKFRQDLMIACKKKNVQFILDHLHPKARGGFGSAEDAKEFLQVWKPKSRDSEFWSTLRSVLQLGGRFVQDEKGFNVFVAPYVATDWPDSDSCDPFEGYVAVMEEGVQVRTKPSDVSPVVERLSYDVIQVIQERQKLKTVKGNSTWIHVLLSSGREGFVRRSQVRSPIDYRAGFEKINGKWLIAWLLAGD